MSIFVLGSREVVTAFALGGMRGRAVRRRSEALDALDQLGPVRLLILEEDVAETIREEVNRLKLDPRAPLVVEIPGFYGRLEERKTPLEMVREALGIPV